MFCQLYPPRPPLSPMAKVVPVSSHSLRLFTQSLECDFSLSLMPSKALLYPPPPHPLRPALGRPPTGSGQDPRSGKHPLALGRPYPPHYTLALGRPCPSPTLWAGPTLWQALHPTTPCFCAGPIPPLYPGSGQAPYPSSPRFPLPLMRLIMLLYFEGRGGIFYTPNPLNPPFLSITDLRRLYTFFFGPR